MSFGYDFDVGWNFFTFIKIKSGEKRDLSHINILIWCTGVARKFTGEVLGNFSTNDIFT